MAIPTSSLTHSNGLSECLATGSFIIESQEVRPAGFSPVSSLSSAAPSGSSAPEAESALPAGDATHQMIFRFRLDGIITAVRQMSIMRRLTQEVVVSSG